MQRTFIFSKDCSIRHIQYEKSLTPNGTNITVCKHMPKCKVEKQLSQSVQKIFMHCKFFSTEFYGSGGPGVSQAVSLSVSG